MKKLISLLSVVLLFAMMQSCQKDSGFFETEEVNYKTNDTTNVAANLSNGELIEIDVDQLSNTHGNVETRSDRVTLSNNSVARATNTWYGLNVSRSELNNYIYYIEVRNGTGIAHPYVYGNINGGSYRFVKNNTIGSNKTLSMTIADLYSYETHGYIGINFVRTGSVQIIIYRQLRSSGGCCNTTFNITPYAASPSFGIAGSTVFNFEVRTTPFPTSLMTAEIEFRRPDNSTVFSAMTRNSQNFTSRVQFLQVGTYHYRYIVRYNGQIKYSNWMSINILSNNNGGSNCVAKPSKCSSIIMLWDPVCGCDGKTYTNQMAADCVDIRVVYKGECRK